MPTQTELLIEARKFAKEERAARILRKHSIAADVEYMPLPNGKKGFFKVSVLLSPTQYMIGEFAKALRVNGIGLGPQSPSQIEEAFRKSAELKAAIDAALSSENEHDRQ